MRTTALPVVLLLLSLNYLLASCKNKTLFHALPASETGIHFNNKIVENDSINPIDKTNIYNGGGVGVGDFNNDGLQDLYFTGNLVGNELYLNKGKMKFTDITREAGVSGGGQWCRGVAVVDINNDGWQDMYVCTSMSDDPKRRQNLLYVNEGLDSKGVPHFKEMAAAYGLADTTHSTMAAFFDYDNDGDLDMYLTVNQIVKGDVPSVYRPKMKANEHPSTGRLYRNDYDSVLQHPVYTNVSQGAGTTIEGYGHSTTIADFNRDGWKDIFVTNDFNSNDLLYINNHDGTFTDKAALYFKHTSANGMGQDVVDINNDGLADVVELDMNPEDNFRKKMMMNGNSYQNYQNSDYYGYQYQYVRNTLQLNQGPRVVSGDSIGDPVFSDVGYFAGVAETDWSWTPLVTDFDNDGLRDIVITNGYPKDVTDHDFIAFRREAYSVASKKYVLDQIPQVKLHNYAFRNRGHARFENESAAWGLLDPTFSNGAAYADLDNDGDMDMVVNNINDEPSVYQNSLNDGDNRSSHYLGVQLVGDGQNRNGFGAWVEVYSSGTQQVFEVTPYRGYLSTMQWQPHFGLDTATVADSVVVKWPNGEKQVLRQVKADAMLTVNIADAHEHYDWLPQPRVANMLLTDVTDSLNLHVQPLQRDYIDFNVQKLLPHKFSEYGPSLAAGDLNGDGLDDLVVGGNYSFSTTLLFQQPNGRFLKSEIPRKDTLERWVNAGIALFDADGDGDLDLYCARGGYEAEPGTHGYQDQLWINNGKGDFSEAANALPTLLISKSCVRPFDYDKDGDLDLFLAGRVDPWNYPKPTASYILRNDSKKGHPAFTDVTASVAPFLGKAGLISDAVTSDFNGDGWPDLVLAGEWSPVRFLQNNKGIFREITANTGVASHLGWWNSIVPGDFDNDGDMDYVVSNLGLNSFYRATEKEPVKVYAKDFDRNGSYDALLSLYLPRSNENEERREFVAHTRDDIAKQMISFRSKFQNYRSYATATFSQLFKPEELADALVLKANDFRHSLLRNNGNGTFELTPMPIATQAVCLNGMVAEDVDGDGNLDITASGNDFGTEPSVGRYDGCNGLVLKGDGKGGFSPLSILQSGLFVPGDGKALVKLRTADDRLLFAVSQHRGPLRLFEVKQKTHLIPVEPADVSVTLHLKNGSVQKQELGYGASMLSQSSRFLAMGKNVSYAEIRNASGKTRIVPDKENSLSRR